VRGVARELMPERDAPEMLRPPVIPVGADAVTGKMIAAVLSPNRESRDFPYTDTSFARLLMGVGTSHNLFDSAMSR